ncbi:MAG: hypothetical protein GY859_11380 [Desulfobacterales bacterium]|nr:hypothetical protein [Desulfobacterales bacterium]
MDKSREYIEMCDKASEIQRLWKQQYGDFLMTESGRIQCWLPDHRKDETVRKGFGIKSEDGVIRLSRYIWLPRMDQLIEAAQEKGRRYDSISLEFFNWCRTAHPPRGKEPNTLFRTVEKAWLAFVMHKNFGKVWEGAAWTPSAYRRPSQRM